MRINFVEVNTDDFVVHVSLPWPSVKYEAVLGGFRPRSFISRISSNFEHFSDEVNCDSRFILFKLFAFCELPRNPYQFHLQFMKTTQSRVLKPIFCSPENLSFYDNFSYFSFSPGKDEASTKTSAKK